MIQVRYTQAINIAISTLGQVCLHQGAVFGELLTSLDNAYTFFPAGLQLSVQIAIRLSESPTRKCNGKPRMLETTSK